MSRIAALALAVLAVAACSSSSSKPATFFSKRYCEIIIPKVGTSPLQADVWNTYGLNDCPAKAWAALDTGAV
ncbi:MAG TPA: hypothetical protein VKW77_07840, partial [Acidimicrobiales bacterium]|nr:hypothetical protein [Acidimicrobiales bacterium]